MACTSPKIVVGGVTISTSDFENARELITNVSGDGGDPTLDGYDENIANGNNDRKTSGIQFPPPKQTSLPGEITDNPEEKNEKSAPGLSGQNVVCIPWTGNYNLQISPNFKVKDFTVGAYYPNQVIDYMGFSTNTRVCNLQAVAVNIAEPMLAKFGRFLVTSGLRNKTSTPNGVSQHIKGEAIDIQFPGWSYNRYWENAAWIKDNIPYDQFIFEHSSTTGLAWYHLSYNRSGNMPVTDRRKVMTMYKNNYSSGLLRFG